MLPATALCLLNAFKPLTIDDPAYYAFAAQIAQHPFDPYGFTIFWYQQPQPAHEVLAPPVFLYWWALGIRLVGDTPWLWKLWLWPWCLLLAIALDALLRRVGGSLAAPLLWMITFSASVLPALNLMLDVPGLALSLAAVAAFLRAGDRRWWPGAILAGVLAGLAMQTKYTALVIPPVLLLAALNESKSRRLALKLGTTAVAIAVAVFAAWELFVAARYGASHFLYHSTHGHASWAGRFNLLGPLVSILGGVAVPLGLLGLTAFGVRGRWVAICALSFLLGLGLLAGGPASDRMPGQADQHSSITGGLFGTSGVVTLVLLTAAAFKVLRAEGTSDERFVALWWLVEVASYFVLTPWPAARRLLGVVVVGTLLIGSLAARTCQTPERRRLVRAVAAFGIALGLLFQAIDIDNAAAERDAVDVASSWVRARDRSASIWFVSHLGLQFYGERAGWISVIPDQSRLLAGSWLVIPERNFGRQQIELPSQAILETRLAIPSRWPLSTIPWYYGTNKSLNRQRGPILTLALYRIQGDCTPQTDKGELRR